MFLDFLSSETFWVAVGSIGTIAGVFFVWYQIKLSRLISSADLLLRLEDRFEESEFVKKRKSAAQALKSRSIVNESDVEEIFDFFETVGVLVRKKALDEKLVWNSFFYWLHGYCHFGAKILTEQHKNYPSRYEELVWLHKKLSKIERSRGEINESEWALFLEEESA